jgi:hypothetical protein
MKANEFYCVALKKRVTLDTDDICVVKLKNGRYALKGYCHEVGSNLIKFISNDSVCKMQEKFGKCKKSKRRSKSKKRSKRKSRKSRRKSRC